MTTTTTTGREPETSSDAVSGLGCIGTCSAMGGYDEACPEWGDWMLSIIDYREKEAQKVRDRGLNFALIDSEPMLLCSFELNNFIDDPKKPTRRHWRLDLIGGGQLHIVETYTAFKTMFRDTVLDNVRLGVVAHIDDRVVRASGRIIDLVGEARMMGVALSGSPEIADRVAATLRAIDNTPDNFFALLSHRQRCAICNRPLRDEISMLVGVGPDCARRYRIPHSLDAATRRLRLRRHLGLEDNQTRVGQPEAEANAGPGSVERAPPSVV
jgi:Family of unknown function (DUF6011)